MKSFISLLVISAVLGFYFISCQSPETPVTSDIEKQGDCVSIQEGTLTYSAGHYLAGQPLQTGYDDYGYNYQAHIFNGSYFNAYAGRDGFPAYDGDDATYLAANPTAVGHWAWPFRDTDLMMKWNDSWLSNKDCDNDGALDRYYGFPSYIGSGAWLTNHMSGTYEDGGQTCHWNYFVKIVAAPEDATQDGGIWYAADGTEIGPVIWGAFAIIQQVENDPCAGIHGIQYLSPDHAGLGGW